MKILIPVDGSRLSVAAAEFVAQRATLFGAAPEVVLAHAQWPIPPRAVRVVGRATTNNYYQEQAEKSARAALKLLKGVGLDAKVKVVIGNPADAIALEARRSGADLIVMGSHGRSELKRMLLGSVAYAVLAKTQVPVLLLRGKVAPRRDSLRVAIAVDGSPLSLAAVKFALRHREMFGPQPEIALVHVAFDFLMPFTGEVAVVAMPSSEQIKSMQDAAFEAAFGPARRLMRKAQAPFTEVRLVGAAGDEIAAYARRNADLTLLGSHGFGAFKAAVLGSVAMRVAASGNTPLLIVRPRRTST